MEESQQRDLGVQPLDTLLDEIGLSNHELVAFSTDQLTHKQVQKARKGRRITVNIQRKILTALNVFRSRQKPVETTGEEGAVEVVAPKPYVLTDLFNYRG
jgi:hypothetical protein